METFFAAVYEALLSSLCEVGSATQSVVCALLPAVFVTVMWQYKYEISESAFLDLKIIVLSEVSQRKKNSISYHLCVESKK